MNKGFWMNLKWKAWRRQHIEIIWALAAKAQSLMGAEEDTNCNKERKQRSNVKEALVRNEKLMI